MDGDSPSHTVDISPSDVSCGPSDVAPSWTETQPNINTRGVTTGWIFCIDVNSRWILAPKKWIWLKKATFYQKADMTKSKLYIETTN